ncbi:MAG TPA: hypothetical protein ENF28_05210 [Proteobacteria bacterium]|nr:hypothetical protein [Pseudomonadota bacterium]
MPRLWIPIVELLGFLAMICGGALWIIHQKYNLAMIIMGIGGVMIIIGMLAERFIVGYYDD